MNRDVGGRAIRIGLLGGGAIIYLALVGMVEKFQVRNLIGAPVTLGRFLVALPPFVAGWLAVRPRVSRGEVETILLKPAALTGLVCGAVAGGFVAVWVSIARAIGLDAARGVFLSVTDGVVDVITYGHEGVTGAALMIAGGAALGVAGSLVRFLPKPVRRPFLIGAVATLLAALLQRIVPTILRELGLETRWLYSGVYAGLTVAGAVIIFVAAAAVPAGAAAIRTRRGGRPGRESAATAGGDVRKAAFRRLAPAAAIIAVAAALPSLIGPVLSQILGTVGIFLLMGVGLNIVVGYAGLLDLGYVAFFAVGAYLTAILTGANVVTSLGDATPVLGFQLSFYVALPIVVLFAAFVGVVIGAPVLRLRGDYLAIVTLGLGEIARVLVTSDWLKSFLGGAQGLRDIPAAPIGGVSFRDPQNFYYLVLALCVFGVFVSWRLQDSRIGRAWNAMREDEQVAEAMGISTIRYKLLAFAMGGAIGCMSGALFSVQIGSLAPTSFDVLVSITALSVIILGGIGSLPGVIVGALALIGIPALLSEFEEFRLLLYGAILIGIMILRPQGLIPNVRRSVELLDEERSQDAWFRTTGVALGPEDAT